MKKFNLRFFTQSRGPFLFTVMILASPAYSATLYWDSNGTVAGAGDTPTGTWGTDSYWNTSATGGTGTFTTNLGSTLAIQQTNIGSFSAGTDAVNPYTVTINGTRGAMGINFVDGATTLTGGTIALPLQADNVTATAGKSKIWNENTTTGTSVVDSTIQITGGSSGIGSVITLVAGNGAADLDLLINGAITQTVVTTPTNYELRLGGDGNGKITSDLGISLGSIHQGDTTWSGTWTIAGNQSWVPPQLTGRILLYAADSFGANAQLVLGETLSDVQHIESITVTNSNPAVIVRGTVDTATDLRVNNNTEMQIPGDLSVRYVNMASAKITLSDGTTAGNLSTKNSLQLDTGSTFASIVGGSPGISTLELTNGSVAHGITLGGSATYDNNLSVIKNATTTMTMNNVSTYTGDTLINSGQLILGGAAGAIGQLGDTDTKIASGATFTMNDNSIYNMVVDNLSATTITGTGTATLNGDFNFNLTNAALAWGNTWQIVANSTLTETYSNTFSVPGFTQVNNVWSKAVTIGGVPGWWEFSETTGALRLWSTVPEPSSVTLGLLGSLAFLRRRRVAASN